MANCYTHDLDSEMAALGVTLVERQHLDVDAHAARALAEIKVMAAAAIKVLHRKADFPNRSAGQRRRHTKGVK